MDILITGGAGFIGSNLTVHMVRAGHRVTVFDDLSRHGSDVNLRWINQILDGNVTFIRGDVRDAESIKKAVLGKDAIYHLAGQVAVTSSIQNPRDDFERNALGTFNTLEAARSSKKKPIFIYSSTNKVYGGMEEERVIDSEDSYRFENLKHGVPETYPIDFHSPYGCSKGTGDQYVRDYSRIYDLPTVVFRQSCIYGIRQMGVEDQGWLAYFVIRSIQGKQITIYGDGRQVRDVLYIDDLVRAYEFATRHIDITNGQVYNIGGGPEYTLSIWSQTKLLLEKYANRSIPVKYGDWRSGDQHIYISDIRKAKKDFGWYPKISPEEGIGKLWQWVSSNINLFS